ncbi:MAG: tetraacyldisaccharide 4'-kinase [Gammaproteobacteria bacterium]|nr:tetraacyldisaccharide 4'-kinase [Gammaproteobacteria bacterium]
MSRVGRIWSSLNPVSLLLLPLSLAFGAVTALRRVLYRSGVLRVQQFDVPIVIVGNITVGGTGKTPLVIWLADYLRQRGFRPGIVSRGYGGRASQWPQQVRPDSDPSVVGDEAVMLASRTGCPMCVGPDRPEAIRALLAHTDADIVISDDGLQHYAMGRDLEIAVIDGDRRLGNGLLLPAGPLREPRSRLARVDLVVVNGQGGRGEFSMKLFQPTVRGLHDGRVVEIDDFAGREIHAVAGIGNPQRFFALLQRVGLRVVEHPFADHHAYRDEDLAFSPALPILMTEKDAVKCRRLACKDCWVVHVDAQPDTGFVHRLNQALKDIANGQETP